MPLKHLKEKVEVHAAAGVAGGVKGPQVFSGHTGNTADHPQQVIGDCGMVLMDTGCNTCYGSHQA